MSIKIRIVPRKNPQNTAAAPKYYAQVAPKGKLNLRNLSKRVASHTTMSAPDIYGVLMGLEEEIIVALKNGEKVELGNLCIFYPSVQSEGADSEADFNIVRNIKKKGIRIRPKQTLSSQMAQVSVEKLI